MLMKTVYNHAARQIEETGGFLSWVESPEALTPLLSNHCCQMLRVMKTTLPPGSVNADFIRAIFSAEAEEYLLEAAANRYWMWNIVLHASLEADESSPQIQREDCEAGAWDQTKRLIDSLIRFNFPDTDWLRDFSVERLLESVEGGQIGKICRYTCSGVFLASPHEPGWIVNPLLTIHSIPELVANHLM